MHPPELFYKKAVLKHFAIFTEKHLCWSLFLIKLQAFRPSTESISFRHETLLLNGLLQQLESKDENY